MSQVQTVLNARKQIFSEKMILLFVSLKYFHKAQHVITTTTRTKFFKNLNSEGQWNTAYDLENN